MRVRRIGVMLAVCVLWTLGVSEVFGQETGAEAPRTQCSGRPCADSG